MNRNVVKIGLDAAMLLLLILLFKDRVISIAFHERFYRPENVVLVITGDFDFDEAERLIGEYYGGWQPGYVAPAVPQEPLLTFRL